MPLDADDIPDVIGELLKTSADSDRAWGKSCHDLLDSPVGRRWFGLAMTRYNLMGSVFSEGLDPLRAAHVDGRRHVLSDMLNSSRSYKPTSEDEPE